MLPIRCLPWLIVAAALLSSGPAQAAVAFAPGVQLPMEQNSNFNREAVSAAAADANGDGRTDVLFFTTGFGRSSTVSLDNQFYLYEQQPDGTMAQAARQTYAPDNIVAYSPVALAFADLDHDNRAEIIVRVARSTDLAVLQRGVDGVYREAARIPCPLGAGMIRVADLDGDGHVELLAHSGIDGVAIMKGNGSLAFAPPVYVLSFADVGAVGSGFALADANADGRQDMLGVAPMGFGIVDLNLGTPDHYFTEPERITAAPRYPEALAFGHFSSSRPAGEIAVLYSDWVDIDSNTGYKDNLIRLFTHGPQGMAPTTVHHYARDAGMVASMQASDLDDDGDDDLVIFHPSYVNLVFANGDGTFDGSHPVFPENDGWGRTPSMTASHIADFNGDGCKDLGTVTGTYIIYYRTGCAGTPKPQMQPNPAKKVSKRLPDTRVRRAQR
ncbi:FG-GAP repeat domain-containing protein [Lysobacter tyrosinilyticus]